MNSIPAFYTSVVRQNTSKTVHFGLTQNAEPGVLESPKAAKLNKKISREVKIRDWFVQFFNKHIVEQARIRNQITGSPEPIPLGTFKYRSIQAIPFGDRGIWEYPKNNTNGHSSLIVPIVEENGVKKIIFIASKPLQLGGKTLLSFPGGAIGDEPENKNETAEQGALRETVEEIGYDANRIESLGSINYGRSQTIHIFLANDLKARAQQSLDPYEKQTGMHIVKVPLEEVFEFLNKQTQDEASGKGGMQIEANLGAGLTAYIEYCALHNKTSGLFANESSGRFALQA